MTGIFVFNRTSVKEQSIVAPSITDTEESGIVLSGDTLKVSTTTTFSDLAGKYDSKFSTTTYSISGTYSTYIVTMYPLDYDPNRDPKPATTTCSAFTVSGGDEELISKYALLVKEGNSINHIDQSGKLVLNINLNDLTVDNREALISYKPTTILVKDIKPSGKDGFYCQSMIKIIDVK